MKRVVKLFVAVVVLAVLSVACNHYVCPAYTSEKTPEQNIDEAS